MATVCVPFAIEEFDDRNAYGEERWTLTGLTGDQVLTVVYTERNGRLKWSPSVGPRTEPLGAGPPAQAVAIGSMPRRLSSAGSRRHPATLEGSPRSRPARGPTVEYNFTGDISRDELLKKAKAAASTVKPDDAYSVLVTQSDGRT
jgi:hypothetical protein